MRTTIVKKVNNILKLRYTVKLYKNGISCRIVKRRVYSFAHQGFESRKIIILPTKIFLLSSARARALVRGRARDLVEVRMRVQATEVSIRHKFPLFHILFPLI